MAYKKTYAVLALVGICGASGAAWWWQNKPANADGATPAASSSASAAAAPSASSSAPGAPGAGAPGAAPGGAPARPPAVEVAKVQAMTLVDETQAVGSLR